MQKVGISDHSDVQYYEEYENNRYRKYNSSLGQVLRNYPNKNCRRLIIFAERSVSDGGPHAAELDSFFPPSFWRIVEEDLNGAFGLERYEEGSELTYDTWSTFKMKHVYQGHGIKGIKYHWSQVSVFTRQSKDKQFVLFVDCPKAVVDQIVRTCLSGSSRSVGLAGHVTSACRDPFIWHALLIGGLETEYESDYWGLRDIVRKWERERHGEPDFPLLHDLGRHLIHAKEIFEVATNTINSIVHHHRSLYDEFQATGMIAAEEQKSRQKLFRIIQEKLYISDKDMTAKQARATSLNERLHNEINLAYHVVTQKSNQLSINLASIARRDNATMKALALIGVLYLPGTFISGIFGMSFFNYNPQGNNNNNNSGTDWMMSDKFWIYWTITIPVTIFTVMLWAMLDETVEMYKYFMNKVKVTLQDKWNERPRSNRQKDEEEASTNDPSMMLKV
ncbi:hypothetical protein EYB25_002775 [Talaromyces marneffei]|nr:uncharacterized protein EYB26_002788 [Talaromyces marneffei]KAE8554237.1 hypothetical protein EYB25_002775 [Talaromyces marneffei]QGA15132.1 hypothetical protein EYB26_002788 [Talaromyces marneffei]